MISHFKASKGTKTIISAVEDTRYASVLTLAHETKLLTGEEYGVYVCCLMRTSAPFTAPSSLKATHGTVCMQLSMVQEQSHDLLCIRRNLKVHASCECDQPLSNVHMCLCRRWFGALYHVGIRPLALVLITVMFAQTLQSSTP